MLASLKRDLLTAYYRINGSKPWSLGYGHHRVKSICNALNSPTMLDLFVRGRQLPTGYGVGVDERCIEYPWVLSRLGELHGNFLDAGSALNHNFILEHQNLADKKMHILTLAPEPTRMVSDQISYIYGDLRDIPIKDNFYDCIVSVSVIEHVGFNNSIFTTNQDFVEDSDTDYRKVLRELWRVLKPDGQLFITLPFGKYKKFSTFQQYDIHLLEEFESQISKPVSERVFYNYTANGWRLSNAEECADSEYFDYCMLTDEERLARGKVPNLDGAAAARSVVCLKWIK